MICSIQDKQGRICFTLGEHSLVIYFDITKPIYQGSCTFTEVMTREEVYLPVFPRNVVVSFVLWFIVCTGLYSLYCVVLIVLYCIDLLCYIGYTVLYCLYCVVLVVLCFIGCTVLYCLYSVVMFVPCFLLYRLCIFILI
jgi:hypothetical protein